MSVEKKEVGPGRYVATDKRYRLPNKGETEAEAIWAERFKPANGLFMEFKRMVRHSRRLGNPTAESK